MSDTRLAADDWGVAIVLYREDVAVAWRGLEAVVRAAEHPTTIDLLVNGNPALVDALRQRLPAFAPGSPGTGIRLWSIPLADKAHAINLYLHTLWRGGAGPVFFVDGYAVIRPDALVQLADALADHPEWLAATGVPTSGRSADRLRALMLREGGLHGNLFALAAPAVQALRQVGFRLPVGLYRTDSTLGAILAFGLDPSKHRWAPLARIGVVQTATWDTDERPIGSTAQWRSQFNRKLRQAQGALENRAVQALYAHRKLPADSLPRTVESLVLDWARRSPRAAAGLMLRQPLCAWAWSRLKARAGRPEVDEPPALVASYPATAGDTVAAR